MAASEYNPDDREARLPLWAQERLRDYRRDIESLTRRLHDVARGTEQASFFYEYFDGGCDDRKARRFYIPRLARLQHCNGAPHGRGILEFQEDNHERDPGWVKVYAHDGSISVQPVAANVIRIRVEPYR